jgi:hypothetical protein
MRRTSPIVALIVASVALLTACGGSHSSELIPQATPTEVAAAGLAKVPVAPDRERVDLDVPAFSHPTRITNTLFPISEVRSAVLSGHVEGKPFHTETTLLPVTRIVEWNGQRVETLVSQYTAFLGGRIEEVALDKYAQADDGSVWYFGEDVYDYSDGDIVSREGTWIAGPEHPPAMIMPAHPQVGDVYRSENAPGLVFEEVTVRKTGVTVSGPTGRVEGAMIGSELHSDGTREDKTFAPGYGEFFTGGGGDVEAMALAAPVDAVAGPVPAEVSRLSVLGLKLVDLSGRRGSTAAAMVLRQLNRAWSAAAKRPLPPRIAAEMDLAVRDVSRAAGAQDREAAGSAAIAAARAALDLELRYRSPTIVDRDRFLLWTCQVEVDAAASDRGGVHGDVSALEWIRDRFALGLSRLDRTLLDTELTELRALATDGSFRDVAGGAVRLRNAVVQAALTT